MRIVKLQPVVIGIAVLLCAAPSFAKKYSVEDRQTELMQVINSGQKSGQLTTAQAKKLRSDLADVSRSKKGMLKPNGTVTADDEKKLEAQLNDVSVKITKLELGKGKSK